MTTRVDLTAEVLALRTGSDGAGLIAFAVVAALFVAGWFLYRSLSRHLRRIDFADGPDLPGRPTGPPTGEPTAPTPPRQD